MTEGTALDWGIIARHNQAFAAGLPDRMLAHLRMLEGDAGGFAVDRLEHSLQTATRLRGGEDDEYVVCALLHDIGDILGPYNHADIAASVLKPFVSDANHWMVEQHGIFQGYYFFHHLGLDRNQRERTPATSSTTTTRRSAWSTTRPRSTRPTTRCRSSSSSRPCASAEHPAPQHLHARRRQRHGGRRPLTGRRTVSRRRAAAWRP